MNKIKTKTTRACICFPVKTINQLQKEYISSQTIQLDIQPESKLRGVMVHAASKLPAYVKYIPQKYGDY